MKLFNIPQKRTEGQCDAMRCKETDITRGWKHPGVDFEVSLCKRHASELKNYIAVNEGHDLPATPTTTPTTPTDLTKVLVSNLAVKSGVIESQEEKARKLNEISKVIKVTDITTRDKADKLLNLMHEEEKAVKKEIAAMYKPVKDAAKSTKERLDSWFGDILAFYAEGKVILKEKLGDFLRAEKAKEDVALEVGDHDAATQCATEASENVRLKRSFTYAIQNEGVNLPIQFMVPDETKNKEIIVLLPRELLRPNYELIEALVKQHGKQLNIPDVLIIMEEEIQMKGKRTK